MTRKILIFSTAYHPFIGGAEMAIKEITDRIDPDDIRFDMITLRFDGNLPKFEKIGNVNVHRIGFTGKNPSIGDLVRFPLKINKLFFPFWACLRAFRLHKKNRYDAVWAMMAAFAGFGAMFFKLRHPKTPYLLTLQEGDPIPEIKKKTRFVKPLFSKIFTKADFIQAISTYLGKWARNMGFDGPLEIVPNGVDTKLFAGEYSKEELIESAKVVGKKEGDRFLVTTSRLVKKNAVDDVIRSLKYLPENVKFLVLGDGPDSEMLRKLAEEEGVAGRVIFRGAVGYAEIPKYLKIADVFVRPSLSEGMGNSFIEAMAAGLPVIATQEGGIADFLFDSERNPDKEPTGWAVNPRDPKGIAETVKKILDNPGQAAKTAANARKLALEKYDWDLIAEKMKSIFERL